MDDTGRMPSATAGHPLARLLPGMPGTPDPASPLTANTWPPNAGPGGLRWSNYRQRRATILAQARIRFAEGGQARVQIRALAQACGMSAQTIYNLVGDRDRVLCTALAEYVAAIMQFAAEASAEYPNYIMAQVDAFGLASLEHPALHCQLTRCYLAPDPVLHGLFERGPRHNIRAALAELRGQDALQNRVDIDRLATQLCTLGAAIVLDWSRGLGDRTGLRADLAESWGMMLLSALRQTERARLESWLDRMPHAGSA